MRIIRKAFIKRSKVSRASSDTKAFPTVQAEYMGKVRMVEVVMPYGLSAWIPLDALGHQFNINGNEDDQAAIFNVPTERFKLDAPGEVALGNLKSRSVVYFRENGDIEVIGKNNKTITIDKEMIVTALSGLTINADVIINGTLDVTGLATVDTLTVGSQPFASHVHTGVTVGAGNTGGVA